MNSEVMQTPQLTTKRLLLLGASSVVLCMSVIMSVFAPFPLALASILYGRGKGYLIGIVGFVATIVFAYYSKNTVIYGLSFGTLILGIGVSEIARRGWAPVKSIIVFGLTLVTLFLGSMFYMQKFGNLDLEKAFVDQLEIVKAQLVQQNGGSLDLSQKDVSIQDLQFWDRTDLWAREIIKELPSTVFYGVFITLWFNMFLVLKSRRLLLSAQDFSHSEKDLMDFKVPFGFVFVLAGGLVLALWGTQLGSVHFEDLGLNIIKCLAIFYFFQGFGVFSDLLNFVGIGGFFRVLIVVMTIIMAKHLIAIAGLFDNWFDFKKYFVKRKTED